VPPPGRTDRRRAPLGPDLRRPWQVCQVGTGTRAGLQLYRHVEQAVAGSYLHALDFDPDRATVGNIYYATIIDPFLRTARKQRLRRTLLHLADHLDATLRDSDLAADTSARSDLPEDVWEAGTGVNAAIQLYRYAVRVLTAHTLFYLWDGYPALDLACCYPCRWGCETVIGHHKTDMGDGQPVLRSKDPAGVEQEMWALFAVYQAICKIIGIGAAAAGHPSGQDQLPACPGRLSP